MGKCLGKLPVRHDRRTLRLASYVKAAPLAPQSCAWNKRTTRWTMMHNDSLGDCTIAAAGHMIEYWTADTYGGTGHVINDKEILAAYSAVSGYDPSTGQNDNGAVELDVLNYWRRNGIGGHKIWAFASVNTKNHYEIKQAVYLFGGAFIGLNLPLSSQEPGPWVVPAGGPVGKGEPGSWGGHAVPVVAYDPNGLTVVTWGALQTMSWEFWDTYCEEAYAVLGGSDWINGTTSLAPNGFDLAALVADLKAISA